MLTRKLLEQLSTPYLINLATNNGWSIVGTTVRQPCDDGEGPIIFDGHPTLRENLIDALEE